MSLAHLQRDFLRAIGDVNTDAGLRGRLRTGSGPDMQQRLGAYRNNLREMRIKVLTAAYPVCATVLGERYWRQILVNSKAITGNSSRDLNAYGEHIPAWLARMLPRHPELLELEYLPELARLEWLVHRARLAADASAFDLARFVSLSEDERNRAWIRLAPALSLFHSDFPVDVIWHRHAASGDPGQDTVGAAICCVYRDSEFEPRITRIEPLQYQLMLRLRERACLADLAHACPPDRHDELAHWLWEWIRLGWIAEFEERDQDV